LLYLNLLINIMKQKVTNIRIHYFKSNAPFISQEKGFLDLNGSKLKLLRIPQY